MMCHAKLTTDSHDADAVAKALNADNVCMDGLMVKTKVFEKKIVSEIDSQSMSTLLACVDDILRCQIASESLI